MNETENGMTVTGDLKFEGGIRHAMAREDGFEMVAHSIEALVDEVRRLRAAITAAPDA